MANRSRTADGVNVRISPGTHARVVLACEGLGVTVSEWMERSALASLKRQEGQQKIARYEAACKQAETTRKPSPSPADFGLPHDYGIPHL